MFEYIKSFLAKNMKKTPKTWYLVTNHQNMLYMLAAGMVMAPTGFRGKHYADSLGVIPGWIPLFRDVIPVKALEEAISERRHLRPCLVSFDLLGVTGPVHVFSRSGKIRNADFPNIRLGKEGIGILVQAPLPLSLVSGICFQSNEDRLAFDTAAKDVSNVDLKPYRLVVDEFLFQNKIDCTWPPIDKWPPKKTGRNEIESPSGDLFAATPSAQAVGGLLAMLFHGANRSDLGVKVFQLITATTQPGGSALVHDSVLAELPNWLSGSDISTHSNTPAKLFWGVVNALAQEDSYRSEPVEVVLNYLENQLDKLSNEVHKSRLERLITDMRSSFGLESGTTTELFERNKGSLSRPLLLFCLREHCEDLLAFSHPLLSDAEYLLAAILFGVRDGWLKLPCGMRDQALSAYVMARMAGFAHQEQEDGLFLPETPSPQPLRALFPYSAESWHKSQINAAIEIAKDSKWTDCIETVITSVDSSPLKNPRHENGNFIFSGEASLAIKVLHDPFLRRLGEWPPIDAKLESKIRSDLSCARKEEMSQV